MNTMNRLTGKLQIVMLGLIFMSTMLVGPKVFAAEAAPKTGSITVHKLFGDPVGDKTIINDGTIQKDTQGLKPLAGVEYTIVPVTSEELQTAGVKKSGEAYDLADFNFDKIPANLKKSGTTDDLGQIIFTDLAVLEGADNLYVIVETGGNQDSLGGLYKKSAPLIVTLPMMTTDGKGFNYDINVYPKSDFALSNVSLHKVDGKTNQALAGATFRLYSETLGKEIGSGFTTDEKGNILVKDLPLGDYYFSEVKAPTGYLVNKAAQRIKFNVLEGQHGKTIEALYQDTNNLTYDGTVNVPNDKQPTVEKTNNQQSVAYGENTTWTISADVPRNISEHSVFNVSDKLDPRLVYTDNLSVKVAGQEIPKTDYTVTAPAGAGGKLIVDFIKGSTVTTNFGTYASQKVEVSFTTKLIAGFVPDQVVTNQADLNFTNVPGVSNETITTPPTATVTTGGYHFKKVAKNEKGASLADAEFVVVKDGSYLAYTTEAGTKVETMTSNTSDYGNVAWVKTVGEATRFVTSADGLIDVRGLAFGNYELKEVKAPTGYRLLTKTEAFTVGKDSWTTTKGKPSVIVNSNMPLLPQTGGIGSVIFTLVGLSLVLVAFQINKRAKKA
ncbi:SpaH/EbpB family LPXTG-anchored major pilin [Vagococcus salmoninarum]|uniref:SpaH/EbpB family LPXTG-anchored major pilin n=1 Tax=Vagococcus salmoninarum TaxID=2739 RepID=UPI0028D4D4FA|nr:SpaH/EbpB family LPXTG-anchored major pilin [Vagococcus salmoninarum]